MNIELIQNFCSVQGYDELYNPEDSDVLEEEDMTVDDGIKHCSYIFIGTGVKVDGTASRVS